MSKGKNLNILQDDLQTIVSRATKIFVNPNPSKKKSFEEKVVGLEKMSGKASGFESLKPRSKPKCPPKKNATPEKGKGGEGQPETSPKKKPKKGKWQRAFKQKKHSGAGGSSARSTPTPPVQNQGGTGATSMSS